MLFVTAAPFVLPITLASLLPFWLSPRPIGKLLLTMHAMVEEIAALECTGTWDLVPLPPHVTPITCKWVYKVKTRSDGSLERYKVRLMARGF
jgi:hypothetical protein